MKSLEQILIPKKVRPTAVRLIVLDVFVKTKYAISLQDIETELSWADKASIFRTLKTFEKHHIIHAIADGHKAIKYALCHENQEESHEIHPHFHCIKCHKTYCLDPQKIRFNTVPNNYTITDYELVVKGVCADCR